MNMSRILRRMWNRLGTTRVVPAILIIGLSTACADMTAKLPAGYVNPSVYKTPEGALQIAGQARFDFMRSLFDFMIMSGTIADEFLSIPSNPLDRGVGYYDHRVHLNSRYLPDPFRDIGFANTASVSTIPTYQDLQRVRSRTLLARKSIAGYGPDTAITTQAEMLVYEAFAEMLLADLYCSGIPLSLIEFEGDFQYRHGSRTSEVYEHAVHLFDTAIGIAGGDEHVRSVASLGKGRALLALGRYQEAANAVVYIPSDYVFDLPLMYGNGTATNQSGLSWLSAGVGFDIPRRATIADRKGTIGLDFLSADDPRVQHIDPGFSGLTGSDGIKMRIPQEQTRVIVASGIEARLIEAEAMLHDGNPNWLLVLNALRIGAGIGGISGLPPLTDPALEPLSPGKTVHDVRVDLLMRERAFWLFFRGTRQGDLRRMIRHYGRMIESVYPQGSYIAGPGYYDQYVDVPIPLSEKPNPFFNGCFARGE